MGARTAQRLPALPPQAGGGDRPPGCTQRRQYSPYLDSASFGKRSEFIAVAGLLGGGASLAHLGWKRKVLAVAITFGFVLSAPSAFAAVLRTTSGVELTGDLETEKVHVRAPSGEMELSWAAILQARRTLDGFDLLLTDGKRIAGVILDESVRIKAGLASHVVPVAEIDVLMLLPPGFPPGSLESNYLPVDRYAGSTQVEACPIRVELDARPYLTVQKRPQALPRKLRFFTCDSLWIAALELTLVTKRDEVRLDLEGILSVKESHDKWAKVAVEISAAEALLARGETARIDAEEEKNTKFTLRLVVPQDKFESALQIEQPLRARLTVDVDEN